MNWHSLFLIGSAILVFAACSSAEESSGPTSDIAVGDAREGITTADVAHGELAEVSAMKAPGIPASAAPNLAFEFRYAFKLPDARIGAVHEKHAEACEVLGTARCQIIDMKYQQIDDDRAEAMLAFKLDPAIARKFGRDAIASVKKAEGVLADGNVTGTNVGGQIEDSQARSAMLEAELGRLEKRLAAKGVPPKERASLQDSAKELRKELIWGTRGPSAGRRQAGDDARAVHICRRRRPVRLWQG